MSTHEQFGEDLAWYALDGLEGEEKNSLEKHLEECPSCRRELEQLRGDAALLAMTSSGPRPPARARARLMNAIEKEASTEIAERQPRWAGLAWVVAIALAVVAAILWNQNGRLRSNLQESARLAQQQGNELEEARRVVETLTAQDAMRISVLPVGTKTLPEGKVIYSRERKGLIFMASHLRPLPPSKAYELWLIPTQGVPIPAGVFKPDAHGAVVVVNPPLPSGAEAKAFAITIEPEQGSTTPTLPIVMMGS